MSDVEQFIEDAGIPPEPEPSTPPMIEPEPLNRKPECNDAGNALRLFRLLDGNARYDHKSEIWRLWDGTRWKEDSDGEMVRQAMKSAREIWREIADIEDKTERAERAQWAKASGNDNRIKGALRLYGNFHGVATTTDAFDKQPFMLNCRNGIVDLERIRLLPHDKRAMLSKMAEGDYRRDAACPTWERFLDVIFASDRELISFVQRGLGYSLCGDVSEQALFFCYGTGRNGKSTMLETAKTILADYAQKAPGSLFIHDPKGVGNTADMARLCGTRFVIGSEVEQGSRFAECKLKDLTGQDTITARNLYQSFFEFKPSHKLWIAGNHRPSIRGADFGIWRRILLIPFTVTIPEVEVDQGLPEKLLAERDGILRWMVEGHLAWRKNGLCPPPVVRQAVNEYKAEEDVIGQFIGDRCLVSKANMVHRTLLYQEYQRWAESEGISFKMSATRFYKELQERGFEEYRKSEGRFWIGLTTRTASA